MRRISRVVRLLTLGLVLGVVALTIPDSAVKPTEFVLVKVDHGDAVGLDQDIVWILAVGSDARPGEDMTRTRGDALQLIGIDTSTHAATAIGVPRDSWVDIPGVGYDKINASLYYGGPQLLGQTVGNLIGIQPDYVFVTRFPNFIAMVNSIGGIDLKNPTEFSDTSLKPKGFQAGRIHLNGYDAMAFSRIRHTLPRGDFDRSAHQELVLRAIQAKVRANADKPGFIERGVFEAMSRMYTDLKPSEMFQLAQAMVQVDPSKITTCVVQGGIGTSSYGASIVLPYTDQARDLGDQARPDAHIEHCD